MQTASFCFSKSSKILVFFSFTLLNFDVADGAPPASDIVLVFKPPNHHPCVNCENQALGDSENVQFGDGMHSPSMNRQRGERYEEDTQDQPLWIDNDDPYGSGKIRNNYKLRRDSKPSRHTHNEDSLNNLYLLNGNYENNNRGWDEPHKYRDLSKVRREDQWSQDSARGKDGSRMDNYQPYERADLRYVENHKWNEPLTPEVLHKKWSQESSLYEPSKTFETYNFHEPFERAYSKNDFKIHNNQRDYKPSGYTQNADHLINWDVSNGHLKNHVNYNTPPENAGIAVGSGIVGNLQALGTGLLGTVGDLGRGVLGTAGVLGRGVLGTAGVLGRGVLGTGALGTGALGTGTIGTGTLGTGTLGTGALGTGVLGTGALGTGTLGTGALGTGALGTGALGTDVLGTGALGTGTLGTGALGTGVLGNFGVGGSLNYGSLLNNVLPRSIGMAKNSGPSLNSGIPTNSGLPMNSG